MAKKPKTLDAHSFFLFEEVWGALLLASVWTARRIVPVDGTVVTFYVSVPFAAVLFGAMFRRLRDLRWPRLLLAPVVLMYLWLFGNNVFFRSAWPIVIPRLFIAILGIY